MLVRWALRYSALAYIGVLLAWPVGYVFYKTFEHGWAPFWAAVTDPFAVHALKMTLVCAAIAVPANTLFGIVVALWLVRTPGRGALKAVVNAIIDLPLALSPIVVGLALILVYAQTGWFGGWLDEHGVQIIFSLPGMVMATMFVSLPFVVREVVPVLREIGTDQEQAAATLGAGSVATFRRITLPAISGGIIYGVVLTTARAIGEYGAVSVVSGKIVGETETLTLHVENQYLSFNAQGAYASSVVLAMIAITTLLLMNVVKFKENRRRKSGGNRSLAHH